MGKNSNKHANKRQKTWNANVETDSSLLNRLIFQNDTYLKDLNSEFERVNSVSNKFPKFASSMRCFHASLTTAVQTNSQTLKLFLNNKRSFGVKKVEPEVRVPILLNECAGSPYNTCEKVWAHLVKDWTADKPHQWISFYEEVVKSLENVVESIDPNRTGLPAILVPGCAQGRLVFELANNLQADIYGLEVSRAQLLVTDYIWNTCRNPGEISFYPYVDEHTNNLNEEARTKLSLAPDIVPQHFPETLKRVQFVGGDFLETTLSPVEAVVTCFFIDCFEDIVACLEKIHSLLKPTGLWINVGPLEYHGAHLSPTMDQIIILAKEIGFTFETDECKVLELPYFNRPGALQNMQIREAGMFLARRK